MCAQLRTMRTGSYASVRNITRPGVHKAFQSQDQDVKKIISTFLKPIFYLTIDCWYSIKYVLQNYTSQNSKPFFIIEKVNFIVATVTTM